MEDGRGWEEEAGRGETTHKASWSLVKISTELQHFGIADNTVNKKGNCLKKGDCVHNPGLFITPSLADRFLNKHSSPPPPIFSPNQVKLFGQTPSCTDY